MKSTVKNEKKQVGFNTKSKRSVKKHGEEGTDALRTPEQEELIQKANEILENLKAHTWKELETHGKFSKNDKISFITDDMLIVGCDVGSDTHYARAIDTRGRELSKRPFEFSNTEEGFKSVKEWLGKLSARNGKTQVVLGLEPTGHYWFDLATWMVSAGISVVQVNPYAVKQSKEIEDNSQDKNDRKDPKLIANLVKDGNYGMPYLPEGVYADLRRLTMFRDQLTEDRGRMMNRLHREMKIYFPEYRDALGKIDGSFTLTLLKEAPFPKDLIAIGEDGIRDIWKKNLFTLYASGGGMVEKCVNASTKSVVSIAGEKNEGSVKNSFSVKPLVWSLNASAGLQASLPSSFGIFLEPGISYHFAGGHRC